MERRRLTGGDRLRLRVAFDVFLEPHQTPDSGGIIMSDSWANEAAKKLKLRTERMAHSQAAMLEKRKLIEEQGPALWRSVREKVKQMCTDLNRECGVQVVTFAVGQTSEISVLFRHGGVSRELKATCAVSTSPDAVEWYYLAEEGEGEIRGQTYSFHVADDRVVFQNSLVPSTPDSIARQMMDGLLNP